MKNTDHNLGSGVSAVGKNKCKNCNKNIKAESKYCSGACSLTYHNEHRAVTVYAVFCKQCSLKFNTRFRTQIFCSHVCYSIYKIGIKQTDEHRMKISRALTGKPQSEEHVLKHALSITGKSRLDIVGKKHWQWKGDAVSYGTLHDWVAYWKGRPKKCDECGITEKQRVYQWANISGEYKRDLSDWVRLCVQCHRKRDRNTPRASIKYTKQGGYLREPRS